MHAALPTRPQLHALIADFEAGLLERDVAVRLGLLALLAGEHILLVGPPGSAKSALARRLHAALGGGRYFERLLTRFSTPEELFGPLSLKALEDDRYERLIDGYLPTASVAFLDEVFKANSAILNALLGLLNERAFDNGRERIATPLVSVVGASNEVPADEALLAFYDRFLLRVPVAHVSDAAFAALLDLRDLRDAPPPAPPPLAAHEREAVVAASQAAALSGDALAALAALRTWLAAQAISMPSDRRWRQLARLMRIAAASEGRAQADELDLWLAPYVVAALPEQAGAVADWFVREVVRTPAQDAAWFTRAVQAFEQQLDIDIQTPAEADGAVADDAGKLAAARTVGGGEHAQGDPLASMRIVSAALQERQRKRYGRLHIDTRVAQVTDVAAQAEAALAQLTQARDTLAARLAPRLWWPPSVVQAALAGPNATLAVLQELHTRLLHCAEGFASLPVDHHPGAGAQAVAPLAVPV
jgi:MoxR-like ATPase